MGEWIKSQIYDKMMAILVFVVGSLILWLFTGTVTYIKKVDATEHRVQTLEKLNPEIKQAIDKLDQKVDENNKLIIKVIMSNKP